MKYIFVLLMVLACSGESLSSEQIKQSLQEKIKELNTDPIDSVVVKTNQTEAYYPEDVSKWIPEDFEGLFTEWKRAKKMDFGDYQISQFSEHLSDRYRYNRFGKYYDEEVLKPDNKYEYVSVDYTITTNQQDPYLPALAGFWVYPDRTVVFAGVFHTKYYKWTNEKTYRGKHDKKNDFRYTKSIRFTSALMIPKDSQAALEVGFVGDPCVYRIDSAKQRPRLDTSDCFYPIRQILPIDEPQNMSTVYVFHSERLGRKIEHQGLLKPIK